MEFFCSRKKDYWVALIGANYIDKQNKCSNYPKAELEKNGVV
jgi:hypothetical protein